MNATYFDNKSCYVHIDKDLKVLSTRERSPDNFASSECYVNTMFDIVYINSPYNRFHSNNYGSLYLTSRA